MIALDRQTGRPVWQYPLPAPDNGGPQDVIGYGFAGAALANDLVVVGGIDGRVYAFRK